MNDVIIIIPALIRKLTNGQESIIMPPGTVAECLTKLTEEFPDLKKKFYATDGSIAHNVNFLINKNRAKIDDTVKPGDELMIFFAAAGG